MAKIFTLDTFNSTSGNLTVYNNTLPGDIKRVFYIHSAGNAQRGGHRHHKAWNALICLVGQCHVYVQDGQKEEDYTLVSPDTCLVLEPKDWHVMDQFSDDAVLLVLSNEPYDQADYIDEPYPSSRYAHVNNS
ncbi:sugar 3,4-ketoisomerase [Fibrella forsythiae]|uniref:FdtA/QdtA family cupin domain-containing protein n=1 Tax=Fibrella forsythiae TaxID=2817061 RepID=A0ABS3JBV3_9BACT|nr:FdtA/QdtA family cupin domain-containing protein [Fibrella forsythiae]MBO0947463.1 FdtA/QdtA family cupin domain-containing protein [Fibrella forsythiae]